MRKDSKTNIGKIAKKVISWTIGIPAAIVACGEPNDLRFWYVPFVALGIVIAILAWNHAFREEEEYQPKFVSRRMR